MGKQLYLMALILFASTVLSSRVALSDPLLRVLKSDQLKEIVRTGSKLESRHKESWVDPDSHYGSLFYKGGDGTQVLEWLTASMRNFPHEKEKITKGAEYLSVSTIFRVGLSSELKLNVIVPHPKYMTAAAYGVLQVTRDQQPAKSQILSKETIVLRKQNADLYHLKDGSCSLQTTVARGTSLILASDDCKNLDELLELAKIIDIPRLNRKLNS
jgi:hypothetical protein